MVKNKEENTRNYRIVLKIIDIFASKHKNHAEAK